MERPSYLEWIIEEDGVVLDNGEPIKCFRIDYLEDERILDAWAVHVRRHYISDVELAESCEGLDMCKRYYIN